VADTPELAIGSVVDLVEWWETMRLLRARRAAMAGWMVLGVVLAAASAGHAMDTKAAGRCVALGALSDRYAARAEAVLSAAAATGHRPLVEQRVREEFAYLARVKDDKTAKDGWTYAAVAACGQF
jgi:hypothetical protein